MSCTYLLMQLIMCFVIQDYYHEIHNSLAMLTIFPGDRYYKDTASSTVATAICAQVPLVVTRKFLEVYTFVLPGAVVVADSTSHAIALQQILDMPSKEWSELALEVSPCILTSLVSFVWCCCCRNAMWRHMHRARSIGNSDHCLVVSSHNSNLLQYNSKF